MTCVRWRCRSAWKVFFRRNSYALIPSSRKASGKN
ncbi:MAG: hypothetical protein JHC89_00900 [Acetobacteraceae bacterium]|nr:hypothetical protein [Acetobacteraceae bacterium]